jgi:hypothetical protein
MVNSSAKPGGKPIVGRSAPKAIGPDRFETCSTRTLRRKPSRQAI